MIDYLKIMTPQMYMTLEGQGKIEILSYFSHQFIKLGCVKRFTLKYILH